MAKKCSDHYLSRDSQIEALQILGSAIVIKIFFRKAKYHLMTLDTAPSMQVKRNCYHKLYFLHSCKSRSQGKFFHISWKSMSLSFIAYTKTLTIWKKKKWNISIEDMRGKDVTTEQILKLKSNGLQSLLLYINPWAFYVWYAAQCHCL